MTDNRETIEMLKMLKDQALKSHNDTAVLEVKIDSFNFVLDEAIKALEQQPCEDCISRENLLKAFKDECRGECDNCPNFRKVDKEYKCRLIADLPSVTPKEKTGRWISFGVQGEIDGQIVRAFTCSKCGAISIFRVSNRNIVNGDLCPNCGARMVEPQESEVDNG